MRPRRVGAHRPPVPSPQVLVLRQLLRERSRLTAGVVLCLLGAGLAASVPLLLGHAVDLVAAGVADGASPGDRPGHPTTPAGVIPLLRLVPDGGTAALLLTLGLALVLAMGAAAANYTGVRSTLAAVERSGHRMRTEAHAKLSRLPVRRFHESTRGDLLVKLTGDVDSVKQATHQTLGVLVNSCFIIVSTIVVMVALSPLLTAVAVVAVPVTHVLTKAIGRRARPAFVQQRKSLGELAGRAEEAYTGHEVIAMHGVPDEVVVGFDLVNEENHRAGVRAQTVAGAAQPVVLFIGSLCYVVVAAVGVLQVASGTLSIGAALAFIASTRQFYQPFPQLAQAAAAALGGLAAAQRVFGLLMEPEEDPDSPLLRSAGRVRGAVSFEGVTFRYSPTEPLIENLSVTVDAGSTVAVVGRSGSGKTTLANLLMRFLDPHRGRITLDGCDVASMSRDELRSAVGIVTQDEWLFRGTVAENIAYGTPRVERRHVEHIAGTLGLDRFIRTLPSGYDTVVDNDSHTLSAGERQLIMIARAAMADPQILILDEATKSLDPRTEHLARRALQRLRTGRTMVTIAHRLDTVRQADLILVMEAGAIVERGTHVGLLKIGGPYSRLWAAQADDPADDEIPYRRAPWV